MAYDVPQLLTMSQKELDELFTQSAAGDIPERRGAGHGDRRAGHHLQCGPRNAHQPLRVAGQDVRRRRRDS